jgi:hypothetical protein
MAAITRCDKWAKEIPDNDRQAVRESNEFTLLAFNQGSDFRKAILLSAL